MLARQPSLLAIEMFPSKWWANWKADIAIPRSASMGNIKMNDQVFLQILILRFDLKIWLQIQEVPTLSLNMWAFLGLNPSVQ